MGNRATPNEERQRIRLATSLMNGRNNRIKEALENMRCESRGGGLAREWRLPQRESKPILQSDVSN